MVRNTRNARGGGFHDGALSTPSQARLKERISKSDTTPYRTVGSPLVRVVVHAHIVPSDVI